MALDVTGHAGRDTDRGPEAGMPADGEQVDSEQVDVVVMGAGPAGAATAIACRRLGLSVALVHRHTGCLTRPAEHVATSARRPLADLGLWDDFVAADHPPCAASYTAWGTSDLDWVEPAQSAEPARRHPSAYQVPRQQPSEHGWLVDRRRLNRWLRQAALDAGATLHATTTHPLADDVGFVRPGTPRGRFVVDATGRRGRLAGQLGTSRRVADTLLAFTTTLDPGDHRLETAPVVLVEAVRTGWWHTAPAPDGGLVATFVTDPAVARLSERPPEQVWAGALTASEHTAARLRHHRQELPLRCLPTGASALDRAAGHRWLAVGDAALALDPLGGGGVEQALQGGLDAARTIVATLLGGDRTATARYDADIQARFRYHLDARRRVYEGERRWPTATFWRHRTSVVTAAA